VLSYKLLKQLSALPVTVASPHSAIEEHLLRPLTALNLILEDRLHYFIVQGKLTLRLSLLAPRLEEELTAAIDEYCPGFEGLGEEECVRSQLYQVLAKVSARIALRALVGPEICRNET
jgi:hypothetical protein